MGQPLMMLDDVDNIKADLTELQHQLSKTKINHFTFERLPQIYTHKALKDILQHIWDLLEEIRYLCALLDPYISSGFRIDPENGVVSDTVDPFSAGAITSVGMLADRCTHGIDEVNDIVDGYCKKFVYGHGDDPRDVLDVEAAKENAHVLYLICVRVAQMPMIETEMTPLLKELVEVHHRQRHPQFSEDNTKITFMGMTILGGDYLKGQFEFKAADKQLYFSEEEKAEIKAAAERKRAAEIAAETARIRRERTEGFVEQIKRVVADVMANGLPWEQDNATRYFPTSELARYGDPSEEDFLTLEALRNFFEAKYYELPPNSIRKFISEQPTGLSPLIVTVGQVMPEDTIRFTAAVIRFLTKHGFDVYSMQSMTDLDGEDEGLVSKHIKETICAVRS